MCNLFWSSYHINTLLKLLITAHEIPFIICCFEEEFMLKNVKKGDLIKGFARAFFKGS